MLQIGFDAPQKSRPVKAVGNHILLDGLRERWPAGAGLVFFRRVKQDGFAAEASIDSRLKEAAHFRSDLYPEELLGDIKKAYEDDLVDPGYIGFDDVERDLAMGKERILARLADNPHRRLVEDTVAEMGWWACFREDRAKNTTRVAPNSKLSPTPSSRISRATPKVGRNEPCPCGSGKKYKKCCGA